MGIVENFKEIADLVKKVGDVELYRRIVELEGETIELSRQKRLLEVKNEELEAKLLFSKRMIFKDPYYFADDDPTPYCPKCWEVNMVAVHLYKLAPGGRSVHRLCKKCQQSFTDS